MRTSLRARMCFRRTCCRSKQGNRPSRSKLRHAALLLKWTGVWSQTGVQFFSAGVFGTTFSFLVSRLPVIWGTQINIVHPKMENVPVGVWTDRNLQQGVGNDGRGWQAVEEVPVGTAGGTVCVEMTVAEAPQVQRRARRRVRRQRSGAIRFIVARQSGIHRQVVAYILRRVGSLNYQLWPWWVLP